MIRTAFFRHLCFLGDTLENSWIGPPRNAHACSIRRLKTNRAWSGGSGRAGSGGEGWGGRSVVGIIFVDNKTASWFQGLLASWFQRLLASWFQNLLVSKFQSFNDTILPKFHCMFLMDIDPISKSSKISLDGSSGFIGARLFPNRQPFECPTFLDL